MAINRRKPDFKESRQWIRDDRAKTTQTTAVKHLRQKIKKLDQALAGKKPKINRRGPSKKPAKPHTEKIDPRPAEYWREWRRRKKLKDLGLADSTEIKFEDELEIVWQPHPGVQTEALRRPEFEVLYGGARGGGKTDAGIAWLTRQVHNPQLRALIIRRNADDLRDWVDRANQIYSKMGARRIGKPPEFLWPSGAIFRTGHLKDESAYTKYQGHEYQLMLIEELTQIPSEKAYLRLISSCRSTVKGLKPQIFLTTNPGGIGHGWVKKRFIDVSPWGQPFEYSEKLPEGQKIKRNRIFIHAKIDDNPTLLKSDPGYVLQLEQLKATDSELYKAWRFGDWDVFAGQVYREFSREKHIIRRVVPKSSFNHFLGMDWGYHGRESHEGAFAAVALVMYPEMYKNQEFNRVVMYREWYGKDKTPNEWADIIFDQSYVTYDDSTCDASMHNPQVDGSKPVAELMHERWDKLNKRYWIRMKPGTRNRLSRVATLHNWLSLAPDGLPYLMFTENCLHTIRTIPALIYDESQVEDVDTDGEDHLYDALTYILSNLRFVSDLGGIKREVLDGVEYRDPNKALFLKDFESAKAKRNRDWRVL